MIHWAPERPSYPTFASLMQKLGTAFVMVPAHRIDYLRPKDVDHAESILNSKRYSVIPVSADGVNFPEVLTTENSGSERRVADRRHTTLPDHIPDATPLSEAFFLFNDREWYLALNATRVSGLITYWEFNSREFHVQLYAGLSRLEELSRNALAADDCGIASSQGLHLTNEVLKRVDERYALSKSQMGGNRYVDELEFHHLHDALRKHAPWRKFLHRRVGDELSSSKYDELYNSTDVRNAVMHGRILFPTFQQFKKRQLQIARIGELIRHLQDYCESRSQERTGLNLSAPSESLTADNQDP